MTYTQLKAEVRRRLNETSANFWADADVNAAINDGYAEMSDVSEWYKRSSTVTLTTNTTYYTPSTLTSTEFLSPVACQNATTKKWLEMVDERWLDENMYPRWESISSEPEYMLMRGLFKIGFTPKPTTSRQLTFYYSSIPSALSSGSDEPGFPQEYHFGIVEYALYDLHCQEGEIDKALDNWKAYLEYENGLVKYSDNPIAIPKVNSFNG